MKKIVAVVLCLFCFLNISVSAQEDLSSDRPPEITTIPNIPNFVDAGKPQYKNLNNISLTFFVVNGKAHASYYITSQASGISVTVQMKQNVFFQKNYGAAKTEKTNNKYLTGSYTLDVSESGTYSVYITVTSGGEKVSAYKKFVYNANILMGDINRDGVLQARDARMILRFAARLDAYDKGQEILADIDSNGKVNAADARLALKMSAFHM